MRDAASAPLARALLVLPAVALVQVEKRIALLIGNQAYTSKIGALANPHDVVSLLKCLRSRRCG